MNIGDVIGHQSAKRAFTVAMVGDLSVLLVGPLGTGKTTLIEAFRAVTGTALPCLVADEREPCFCGHYGDVTRECKCSPRAVARWWRRMERTSRGFDLHIETCAVPAKDIIGFHSDARALDLLQKRVYTARNYGGLHASLKTDDTGLRVMEMAMRRLSFTVGDHDMVLRIARAVANLDGSPDLKAMHVAEAIQYRCLVRNYVRSRCRVNEP